MKDNGSWSFKLWKHPRQDKPEWVIEHACTSIWHPKAKGITPLLGNGTDRNISYHCNQCAQAIPYSIISGCRDKNAELTKCLDISGVKRERPIGPSNRVGYK